MTRPLVQAYAPWKACPSVAYGGYVKTAATPEKAKNKRIRKDIKRIRPLLVDLSDDPALPELELMRPQAFGRKPLGYRIRLGRARNRRLSAGADPQQSVDVFAPIPPDVWDAYTKKYLRDVILPWRRKPFADARDVLRKIRRGETVIQLPEGDKYLRPAHLGLMSLTAESMAPGRQSRASIRALRHILNRVNLFYTPERYEESYAPRRPLYEEEFEKAVNRMLINSGALFPEGADSK